MYVIVESLSSRNLFPKTNPFRNYNITTNLYFPEFPVYLLKPHRGIRQAPTLRTML